MFENIGMVALAVGLLWLVWRVLFKPAGPDHDEIEDAIQLLQKPMFFHGKWVKFKLQIMECDMESVPQYDNRKLRKG